MSFQALLTQVHPCICFNSCLEGTWEPQTADGTTWRCNKYNLKIFSSSSVLSGYWYHVILFGLNYNQLQKVGYFCFVLFLSFFSFGKKKAKSFKIIHFERTFSCTQQLVNFFHFRCLFPLHLETFRLGWVPAASQKGIIPVLQKSQWKMFFSCTVQWSNLRVCLNNFLWVSVRFM